MPIEVALLATREHTLDELRVLAESMVPPMLVRDTVREGTVTVTELDETPDRDPRSAAPRRDHGGPRSRAYGPTATLPEGPGFVTEAIVPFEYRRGMALVFALEHMLAGTAVVRGMDA